MARLRRLTLILIATIVTASCQGASTPTSATRTAAPGSTARTPTAPPLGPVVTAAPGGGFHGAPELESAIPAQANGQTLRIESVIGTGFTDSSRHAAGLRCRWYEGRGLRCRDQRQLGSVLSALGRTLGDVKIAVGYDETRGQEVEVQAIRISGITGAQAGEAVLNQMRSDAQQKRRALNAAAGTVGGKQVTVISYANSYPLGSKRYYYASGDILYDIRRVDEATATAILSGLP